MFLNFEYFSLSVFKQNVGFQDWNSQKVVSIANREVPDQTVPSEAVLLLQKQSDLGLPCLSRPF